MLQLAGEYGRYGYRRITALLRRELRRIQERTSAGSPPVSIVEGQSHD